MLISQASTHGVTGIRKQWSNPWNLVMPSLVDELMLLNSTISVRGVKRSGMLVKVKNESNDDVTITKYDVISL